jgi:hypothetical protein
LVSDKGEKGKGNSADTGTNLNEKKEMTEEEEPSLDVLQWYLKMILDNEDNPKPKK